MVTDPPIREGRPEDLPALRALQTELRAPSPDLLAAAADHGVGVLLVAERPPTGGDAVRQRPAGYVLAVPGDVGWIAELVVAPACRRQGVATALLERCCQRLAADCPAVELAVDPENDAALSCYRSLGFRVQRREPGFYEDGPALILRREL